MIPILSDNKEYYYIPKDVMRIILTYLPNMSEVNANRWCTEENILYCNERIKYGYLSFYLSLCNKDFTKHSCYDDEYYNKEYRLCGINIPKRIQFNSDSELDWGEEEGEEEEIEFY